MQKLVAVLFFILAGPVAKGVKYHLEPVIGNVSKDNSPYVNCNRLQHASNIENYDKRIERFKQNYDTSLNVIDKKAEMIVNNIKKAETQLSNLEVISEASKLCVNQHRHKLPSVNSIIDKMKNCINVATDEVPTLLADATDIRNILENYYKKSFESAIISCGKDFNISSVSYTQCIMNAVTDADAYTAANERKFNRALSVADCLSKVSIQDAIDCSYDIETHTITTISEVTNLANNCISLVNTCPPCPEYSCDDVFYIKRSQISTSQKYIRNPFFGESEVKDCIMLKIQ